MSNRVKNYKKILGAWGEKIANQYYQSLGFNVLAKNFSQKCGELDLILEKDEKIVVVEVKTRSNQKFGFGEESISQKKLNNIISTYKIFAIKNNLSFDFKIEICIIEKRNGVIHLDRFFI